MNINPVNAEYMYPRIVSIRDRCEFIAALETALVTYKSLWFTPYGDLYIKCYGPDCSLCVTQRIKYHEYTVLIYNRYDVPI
jgi:hypothetical protein